MEPSSSFLKNSDDVSVSETNTTSSPNNHANNEYKDLISNLPQQENIWNPSQKIYGYKGFWLHPVILEGILSAQENFTAQPNDDIIICSLPKSGTTWLKALCFAIIKRTQLSDSTTNRLLTEVSHDVVPFIEGSSSTRSGNGHARDSTDDDCLPLWATHAPFNLLPKTVVESNCKIIYICRNPKDVFTSLWHFLCRIRGSSAGSTEPNSIPLNEAFQKFCEGVSPYGPYWDHVLGYWRASLEFPERILVIKYEDVLVDTFSYVKRIAEFMGYPFSMEEERQGLVQQVVDCCSFQNLSNLEVNKSKKSIFEIDYKAFYRNGKIGDWEKYLTPEMAAQLDEITEKKFSGYGLSFLSSAP